MAILMLGVLANSLKPIAFPECKKAAQCVISSNTKAITQWAVHTFNVWAITRSFLGASKAVPDDLLAMGLFFNDSLTLTVTSWLMLHFLREHKCVTIREARIIGLQMAMLLCARKFPLSSIQLEIFGLCSESCNTEE